jgi:hypothetical protein
LRRLRALRTRADKLLQHTDALSAFLNEDKLTFVRTPESLRIKDDVNVTTTCSCLMALALTDQIGTVYKNGAVGAANAFKKLIDAPWMSSGLTENNAFTTTLVIRTLGFLCEEGIVDRSISTQSDLKKWEIRFGIKDGALKTLADTLRAADSPAADFIWRSFSDKAQNDINNWIIGSYDADLSKSLSRLVALELQRVIEGSSIYDNERFPNVSIATKQLIDDANTAYTRAEANRTLLIETFPDVFQLRDRSLADIATEMSSAIENFTINEYSPAAAVIYWFVDGVTRSQMKLPAENWLVLCRWASDEFNHQRSLVDAQHDAMMDPVAMSMAACLCARLQSDASKLGARKADLQKLPSRMELEHSIKELFKKQTNGIWPKYFPLFHYQEAGSNFCFAFELLEAILVEFGGREGELLDSKLIIDGLRDAVEWCKKNLVTGKRADGSYIAWNSGGSLESLAKGQPESWATAVVHMFLWELRDMLSARIQKRLLQTYKARPGKDLRAFDDIVDIEIHCKHAPESLKQILNDQMLSGFKTKGEDAERELRRRPAKGARSALLFGPPGTSKTELAEAVAHSLDWPLVQIDPSHFLRQSLDQIYVEAETIFADLTDLSGVVVLFDEMDALVQTRDTAAKLDTAGQFLTTFMLPKLTRLHDQGRLIFFMATNFQDRFDPAIKRPGRFDLLLSMGPPTLKEKVNELHRFVGEQSLTPHSIEAGRRLCELARAVPRIEAQLEFYTFSEFKGLVKQLGRSGEAVEQRLTKMSETEFTAFVDEDSASATLRLRDLQTGSRRSAAKTTLDEIRRLNLDREKLSKKGVILTQMTRYLLDRRECRLTVP